MHGAREADAGDQPDEAGRIAELRREHRTDQRAGAGDGGEVMAEQHPAGGGIVVAPSYFVWAGVSRASSSIQMRVAMNAL